MTSRDYAFAEAEFQTHKRALADCAARLAEVATALREHTDRISIADVGLGPAFPGAPLVIDGAALPTPADIQCMLIRHRGAFERLRSTWDGLPPAERTGLRSPPPSLPTLVPA